MTLGTKEGKVVRVAPAGVILLALGLFLACVFGGYITTDSTQLAPGLDTLIQNIFGGSDAPFLTHAVIALPIIAALVLTLLSRRIQQVPNQIFSAAWLVFFFFVGLSTLFSSFKSLSVTIWFEWLVYGCVTFAVVTCSGRTRGPLVLMAAIAAGCSVVAIQGAAEYEGARVVVAGLLVIAVATGVTRKFLVAGACLAGAAICSLLLATGAINQGGSTDPTFRVYAGWMNPNASAALLVAGFFVAVSLCLDRKGQTSLLAGLGAAAMAYVIFLTGSKGVGSLALPVGTVALGAALTRTKGRASWVVLGLALAISVVDAVLFKVGIGWLGLPLSLGSALAFLAYCSPAELKGERMLRIGLVYLGAVLLIAATLMASLRATEALNQPASTGQATQTAMSPVARIATGGNTQEQSSTFRINLIKSSLHLIKERPLTGWGMATYRYESGRAGLTTTTVFAHNTYLQIFAECGGITFGLFLFGIGVWFWMVIRNHTRLPLPATAPVAGVVAAVVALLAHSLVDSDLYYFGIGIMFFALLGIGLLLSVDSVAPEFVFKPVRILSCVGLCCLALVLLGAAHGDDLKARARYDLFAQSDATAAQDDVAALEPLESFDGDAAYLDAQLKTKLGEPTDELLRHAFGLTPSEKIARALARQQQAQNNPMAAIDTLKLALQRDPYNLTTLTTLMRLYTETGDPESAVVTAKHLVAVEDTSYFKVRSIPESVPTETYEARFDVLAPNEPDPRKKADLLAAGVRGMLHYVDTTTKYIVGIYLNDGKQPDLKMPGYDSLNEARAKLDKTAKAASDAARIYRGLGEPTLAAEMEADGPVITGALAGADSAK